MNWHKIILFFFIFGCWSKYLDWSLGFVLYNIWFVLVLFWMTINALAIVNHLINRKALSQIEKEARGIVKYEYMAYNFMAVISYALCGELITTLFFMLTSVVFMFIILTMKDKKKK